MKTLLLFMPDDPENPRNYIALSPPYGLACVSSALKSNGFEVKLYDARANELNKKDILELIKAESPEIIGFSVASCNLSVINSFLPEIKKELPNVKIIYGGPHPTVEPISTLQNKYVDYIVIGEGDYTAPELWKAIQDNIPLFSIKGIAFKNNGKVVVTERRELVKNLDSLPMADWDSLPIEKYFGQMSTKKNHIKLPASRGCPFQCTFCAVHNILGSQHRRRSPQSIIEELTYLYDNFGVRDVEFADSTLNVNNEWLKELCNELIKMNEKRKIIWDCNVRSNGINKELVQLMKKAGCVGGYKGFESGSPKMLKLMKKGETVEDYKKLVNIFNEVGIRLLGSFIIGMPGETKETIHETLEFAKEIKIFNASFNTPTPFPGTELYEQAKKEGFVVEDWTKFDFYGISYVPNGFTREQFEMEFKKVNKEYYMRISHIIHTVAGIKSISSAKMYLKSGMRLLKKKIFRIKSVVNNNEQ